MTISVVVLGASGAVGSEVVAALQAMPEISSITVLLRRPFEFASADKIETHLVDVMRPESYAPFLKGHQAAICTLGVGQPTKVSPQEFLAVDFNAVLAFAGACNETGVQHFELLGSVASDPSSRSFYLKSKGALRDAIAGLGFQRFSCFQPSMLLTQNNRYGFSQGLMLALWPMFSKALIGGLDKYRGIKVSDLGAAMAHNLTTKNHGTEILQWKDFQSLK